MKSGFILPTLALVLFLTSCYEPRKGCLDYLASNYDASADEACADCCTYPVLKLLLKHKWENSNFILKDTFVNSSGDSVIVLQQKFFMAGIGLKNEKGLLLPFLNKTSFCWPGGNCEEKIQDFKLVSGTTAEVTINALRQTESLAYLCFGVGPDESYNLLDTLQLSTSSDFAPSAGMRTSEGSYLAYKAKMIAGPGLKDTIDISFSGKWRFEAPVEPPMMLVAGKDIILPITVKYDKWFSNVPFLGKDVTAIAGMIKSNTAQAFAQ